MIDEITGPELLVFAGYVLCGIVLIAIARSVRASATRGGPPTRDLHPYEIAYLHGGGRHAIAASITALRLDGAVDTLADGRLIPLTPSAAGPRAAGKPLDTAVFGAIAGRRAGTLAELTAEAGVRAALDQLRDGLIPLGMVIGPAGEWKLRSCRLVLWAWMAFGIPFFILDVFGGFPGVLLPLAAIGLVAIGCGSLLNAGAERTKEGEHVIEQIKASNAHLDPRHTASYAGLPAPSVLLGVALFGTAALMAFDPMFVQTVGLGRYMEMSGAATASGGYSGSSCSSTASVCSSSSCGGGGSCGSSGCGGGGGGGCGGGGGGGCGGGS
ncbi:TIGR04222 domain-containing membrane protein [Actinomadura sp. 3N508]|uniref:TIGR04222 domain-containing membrane protein n=1 Tax=Actinomadura sp. 3N508 TaxID=3375153 RepID=UPI0037B548EE